MKITRKLISVILAIALSMSVMILPAVAAFSDVPSTAWYAQDVNDVQKYGIIEGIGNGKFSPSGTLTVAEAITMAARTDAYLKGTSVPELESSALYQKAKPYLGKWRIATVRDSDGESYIENTGYDFFSTGELVAGFDLYSDMTASAFGVDGKTVENQMSWYLDSDGEFGIYGCSASLQDNRMILTLEYGDGEGNPYYVYYILVKDNSTSISTHWYDKYLYYAEENNFAYISTMIYYGGLMEQCERGDMALMFFDVFPKSTELKRNNVSSIPDLSDEEIIYLYQQGVLTGSDEYGTFHAKWSITRAETATIINRIVDPNKRKTFTLTPAKTSKIVQEITAHEYWEGIDTDWWMDVENVGIGLYYSIIPSAGEGREIYGNTNDYGIKTGRGNDPHYLQQYGWKIECDYLITTASSGEEIWMYYNPYDEYGPSVTVYVDGKLFGTFFVAD